MMPETCPNVPDENSIRVLPRADQKAYDEKAANLAAQFVKNFEKYADKANEEILAAAPKGACECVMIKHGYKRCGHLTAPFWSNSPVVPH